MLRQKKQNTSAEPIKVLWAEIDQLRTMLKEVATNQKVNPTVQQLASKTVNFSSTPLIHTSVVFFTKKQQHTGTKNVLKSIGVVNEFSDEAVFGGKINGTIELDQHLSLHIRMYHFDYYPILKLADSTSVLKIIIYDQSYSSKYPNWELAMQLISKDPAIHILIDISEKDLGFVPKTKGRLVNYFKAEELKTSFLKTILEDQVYIGIQKCNLENYLRYVKQVYQLVYEDFEQKQMRCNGKSILLNKKLLETQDNDLEITMKDIGYLKSKIDGEFRQLTRSIDEKIENFDTNDEDYKSLQEEVTSFLGFVEKKRNKNITLKISEGAIQDKIQKTRVLLDNFLTDITDQVNDDFHKLDSLIENQCKKWEITKTNICFSGIEDKLINETLINLHTPPDKPYEKQISYKGIGGLIMELRTPLFMLMPFMMIFALFGALVETEDLGAINEAQLFFENRPCIAIHKLPEARENEYRKFINEIDALRNPKKGVFDKEINNELITEPQLAVKQIEVQQSFSNKVRIEETLDYHFDSKNRILYLFLNENADRNFVIKKLFDPSHRLLSIPSTTRRGFGIGGLIRAMSGLSEYRFLILVGLVSLILWFIISRKRSMDNELRSSKQKEQQKLNNDLRQFIDKNIKQSLQKYCSKIVDEINNQQTLILKNIEKSLHKEIEVRKLQKTQDSKIAQKRLSTLKTEKTGLVSIQGELRKLDKRIIQVESKATRLLKK